MKIIVWDVLQCMMRSEPFMNCVLRVSERKFLINFCVPLLNVFPIQELDLKINSSRINRLDPVMNAAVI